MDAILPLGNDISSMNFLPSLSAKVNPAANIEAASRDFEAMFAMQLLKPMFDTVPVDDTFGGGNGEQVMRSFMLQEYGKMIAQKGLLGIAPLVKAEMLRAQEGAQAQGNVPAKDAKIYDSKTKEDAYVSRG